MTRKRLASVVSAALVMLAMTGIFAPTVSAASISLTVYGDGNFSPAGTARVFGWSNVPTLKAYLYGNGNQGDCPSRFWRIDKPNTWYSCISSFKIANASCHYGFTFYYDFNYVQPIHTIWGSGNYASIPGGYNDDYNSFKAVYRSTC